MVRHAAEIGWTPLSPSNALIKRGGEAGLLFRGVLEEALHRFNSWMTDDAVRSVVENIQALPPTIEGNRRMLAWLRGEQQWYDEAEQRHRQVKLVDFDDPSANVLHVTWEWRLKPPARKGNRADVMFVINGLPVAIVEHKNPTDADAIERGVTQLRRYEFETPELMGAGAAIQRDPPARLLVRRHLEPVPPLHGAVEGDARRKLPFRRPVVLRANGLPAHAAGLDSLLCRGWRDAEDRVAPAPAPRS